MSKEAIAVRRFQVQLQGALSRAFEKPPAGERGVMQTTRSMLSESTVSAGIRLLAHVAAVTLLTQACASGPRPTPSTEAPRCGAAGTLSDNMGPYYVTGDTAIAVHSMPLHNNQPAEHTGEGEGEVLVRFIVNPQGQPEPASFRVLKATTPAMAQAALAALAMHRFRPARTRAGCNVRQEAHVPFVFR